jgi:hypothetical protein
MLASSCRVPEVILSVGSLPFEFALRLGLTMVLLEYLLGEGLTGILTAMFELTLHG